MNGCKWNRGNLNSEPNYTRRILALTTMATASANSESMDFDDWNEEELRDAIALVDGISVENDPESDVDLNDVVDEESDEDSDPEDNIPLAEFAKWRVPTQTQPNVGHFNAQNVGPTYNLPESASPLDYFFLFLPLIFL